MLTINGMQLELFLGSWPNFKINKIETFTELTSMIVTVSILLSNVIFISVVVRAYYEYFRLIQYDTIRETSQQNYKKKNPILLEIFDGLKEETTISVWFIGLQGLKDMIVPLTLVYGIQNAYLQ